MKILIIGGKQFVGYHIAKAAIQKNHEIIFFNRGKTHHELFPEYLNIIGDRNQDMDKLKDMEFDYVIDTCAYFPEQISKSLDVLEGHFKKYLFISTLSVVKLIEKDFDETVELLEPDYTSDKVTGSSYGPLKVACEETLLKRIKDQAIIIRPGYIVGDMDYTDRFSYYPVMMHFHDEVIMPKTNHLKYQFVDGKDLGEFVIHTLEQELSGIYHTVGPENLTFDQFLEICRKQVSPNCKIHYVDQKWLVKENIILEKDFPTCLDNEEGHILFSANTSKARKAGFKNRPIEDSIQDALDYFLSEKHDIKELKSGMTSEKMNIYLKTILNNKS